MPINFFEFDRIYKNICIRSAPRWYRNGPHPPEKTIPSRIFVLVHLLVSIRGVRILNAKNKIWNHIWLHFPPSIHKRRPKTRGRKSPFRILARDIRRITERRKGPSLLRHPGVKILMANAYMLLIYAYLSPVGTATDPIPRGRKSVRESSFATSGGVTARKLYIYLTWL